MGLRPLSAGWGLTRMPWWDLAIRLEQGSIDSGQCASNTQAGDYRRLK